MLKILRQYLGWRNWAVLYYNSIIENFFVAFYISIITKNFSIEIIFKMILFIILSIFSTTYGYLINDLADKKLDEQHGKENTFKHDSKKKAIFIVVFFLVISILSAWPFWINPFFILIYISWFLITTFYSLPPLRFKEKGKLGLILVVFAQRVLPILLLFAAFNFWRLPDVFLFSIYILFRGFSSDINHQLIDYENDKLTGTKTSAVELGKDRLEKIFRFVLEFEKLFLLAILFYLMIEYLAISLWGILLFVFPFGVFILLYVISIIVLVKQGGNKLSIINPYLVENKNIFQIMHMVFPNIFLPNFLLLYLSTQNLLFLVFIGMYFLFYQLYKPSTIKGSFVGKLLFKNLLSFSVS